MGTFVPCRLPQWRKLPALVAVWSHRADVISGTRPFCPRPSSSAEITEARQTIRRSVRPLRRPSMPRMPGLVALKARSPTSQLTDTALSDPELTVAGMSASTARWTSFPVATLPGRRVWTRNPVAPPRHPCQRWSIPTSTLRISWCVQLAWHCCRKAEADHVSVAKDGHPGHLYRDQLDRRPDAQVLVRTLAW